MESIGWHTYVLRWEAESPESPALIGPEETLNFRQLSWRGRKLAAALQRAGVSRGQIVMVRARRDFDYQLTLALSMLGAIGVSNTAKTFFDFESETDWLLVRKLVPEYPREKQIVVDEPWVQQAFNDTGVFQVAGLESENSVERLCLTSGTTGRSKAVGFSHSVHHSRVVALENSFDTHGTELYLVDLGAAIGALRAFGAAYFGQPYLHLGDKSPTSLAAVFNRVKIERLAGAPAQVFEALRILTQQRIPLTSLKTVRVGGSQISSSIIDQVRRLPGVALHTGYGSTEAGPTTYKANVTESNGRVGYPMPGVTLSVTDDEGRELGQGQAGRLRVHTEYQADGYWGKDQSAAASFADDWFYPGDVALIHKDGELELVGRADDLLNLNGVKVNPADVEELARGFLGTEQLVAIQFENLRHEAKLCIALVSKSKSGEKEFEKALKAKYKVKLQVHYMTLAELPRNEAGKVLRAQLAQLARSRYA